MVQLKRLNKIEITVTVDEAKYSMHIKRFMNDSDYQSLWMSSETYKTQTSTLLLSNKQLKDKSALSEFRETVSSCLCTF